MRRPKLTRSGARGFTLMELLVVVAIIALATAMAMPSLAKFMRGQRLSQAGRIIQSVYNDARRASITQRSKHAVFIGRIRPPGGVGADTYALHVYRDGVGWEPGEPSKLPASVRPFTEDLAGVTNPNPNKIVGCGLKIQDWTDGLPPETGGGWGTNAASNEPTNPFANGGAKTIKNHPDFPYHELRKDGTIACKNTALPTTADPQLFDLNTFIEGGGNYTTTKFKTAPFADMCLVQVGDNSKLCYVSIDQNTGRVRFRVIEGENLGNPTTVSGP